MPMIEATQEYAYAGILRKPGDQFEATDTDADLLYRVKRATPVAGEITPRDMRPQPKVGKPAKKGKYNRRDMKARG